MPLFILTRDYSPIRLDSADDSSLFFSVAATLKYLLRSEVHVYYMTTTTSRQFCIKVNLFHAKKEPRRLFFSARLFSLFTLQIFRGDRRCTFRKQNFRARPRAVSYTLPPCACIIYIPPYSGASKIARNLYGSISSLSLSISLSHIHLHASTYVYVYVYSSVRILRARARVYKKLLGLIEFP